MTTSNIERILAIKSRMFCESRRSGARCIRVPELRNVRPGYDVWRSAASSGTRDATTSVSPGVDGVLSALCCTPRRVSPSTSNVR